MDGSHDGSAGNKAVDSDTKIFANIVGKNDTFDVSLYSMCRIFVSYTITQHA
jgi:hypothetical protein